MDFSIQFHQGLWLVFQNGAQVLSTADYRQVEDALDRAENWLLYTQSEERADKFGRLLPTCGNADALRTGLAAH
jgi:hypothetical protein